MAKKISFRVDELAQLDQVSARLLEAFPHSRVFAFEGPLGVGKTTLIQSICKHLGCTGRVSSPTFGLIHEYVTKGQERVFHFDWYRIRRMEEVYDLGYEDYLFSGSYCFIEWPDHFRALLPPGTCYVQMRADGNGTRILHVTSLNSE